MADNSPITALSSNVLVERVPGDSLDVVRVFTKGKDTFAYIGLAVGLTIRGITYQ